MIPFRRRKEPPNELLYQAVEEAARGRQLAVYDRETGLMAKWYLILRCEEECYRAARYNRPLTLLVAEALGEDYRDAAAELVRWFGTKGRRSDLRAHLGHGSFAVLLPETDLDGATTLARRLERAIPQIRIGISSHRYEGGNFDQMFTAAQTLARRLGLERAIPQIRIGISSHPYEGGNFDQLFAAAAQNRLDGSTEQAA